MFGTIERLLIEWLAVGVALARQVLGPQIVSNESMETVYIERHPFVFSRLENMLLRVHAGAYTVSVDDPCDRQVTVFFTSSYNEKSSLQVALCVVQEGNTT